jgi:hypothetical protein
MSLFVGQVAQSVERLTTGWTVRGSNPGGARFSARPGGFGGVVVSMLASGTRVRGFDPRPKSLDFSGN